MKVKVTPNEVPLLCPNCQDFEAEWESQQEMNLSGGWETFYTCSECGHAEIPVSL